MAVELGCARGTILQAMDQLVAEGYVVAHAGSGLSAAANLPAQLQDARTGLDGALAEITNDSAGKFKIGRASCRERVYLCV